MNSHRQRYLVSYRSDLLGSRTKSFLYAWQYAILFGYKTILFWDEYYKPKNESYAFAELFDVETFTERTGVRFIGGLNFNEFNEITGLDVTALPQVTKVEATLTISDGEYLSPENVVHYHSTHPVFNLKRHKHSAPGPAELFRRIPLSRSVLAGLAACEAKIDINKGVALHIRRGDYLDVTFNNTEVLSEAYLDHFAKTIVGKYISDNAYSRSIPDDDSNIFLFSDVESDRMRIERKFGSRVVDVHGILDQNTNLTAVQRAFIEVLLMSRAGKIIGSRSNFCRLAALIGDVPFVYGHASNTAADAIADMRAYARAMPEGPNDPTHVLRRIITAYKEDFERRGELEQAAICDAELTSPGFSV